MKIEFLSNEQSDIETIRNSEKTEKQITRKTGSFTGGYRLDISGNVKDNAAYSFQGNMLKAGRGQGKTIGERLQEMGTTDVATQARYLAVMSNTMSSEDFGRLTQDGFNPARMPAGETITNLDRIKVKLAQAGVHVAGFTDTVDRAAAAEITGSAVSANSYVNAEKQAVISGQDRGAGSNSGNAGNGVLSVEEIKAQLMGSDLPATDENIRNTVQTMTEAEALQPMDDSSMVYMLQNELEPTLQNVYEAQYAGGNGTLSQGQGYFSEDVGNYYVEKADSSDMESLTDQIKEIITDAGFSPDEDIMADAQWIIQNGIPLTKETLQSYEDLKSVVIPVDPGELMEEIADAIGSGKEASDAYLIRGYRLIKQERILSETRLKMTTEANQALAESNYSIDTEKLEEEVEALKTREDAFYRAAFGRDNIAAEEVEKRVDLAELTLKTVSEIREMPAALIGSFASAEDFTLKEAHEAGLAASVKFKAATELYEAVGTEVREDLGDSITKAFQNIDDILKDMGLETSSDNQRAVRILGYNSMDITEENIYRVRSADITLRNLLNRMNPATTIELIRNQLNPLEASVKELTAEIDRLNVNEATGEKYSEYLFRLERQGQVTEEETNSYIGIYRLFYQIEKSDGAVIGSLVESGRELSLKNLLQEVRSRNKGRIDINIDDKFAGIDPVKEDPQHLRIDTQIKSAFKDRSSRDQDYSGSEDSEDIRDHSERSEESQIVQNVERYFNEAAREVFDRIDPDILARSNISENTTVTELLEILRKNNKDAESTEAYRNERTEEIGQAVRSEEGIYELLVNYGKEVTPDNLLAVYDLLNKRGSLFSGVEERADRSGKTKLKEKRENLIESLDKGGSDEVKEAYESLAESVEEILNEAEESTTKRLDLKRLHGLHRQMTVARSLVSEENYEIPVEINGSITSINLKLLHGNGDPHVDITLETEVLGKAEATFSVEKNEVRGFVAASEPSGTDFLKRFLEEFDKALKSNGMESGEIHLVESRKLNINRAPGKEEIARNEKDGKEQADSLALYRTAKIFITVLQSIG